MEAFRLDYVRPDRFAVFQERRSSEGAEFDGWRIVGSDHFRDTGFWIKLSHEGACAEDLATARSVLADSYLNALRSTEPDIAAVYVYRGRRYLRVEYEDFPPSMLRWVNQSLEPQPQASAVVWLDLDAGVISKVEVRLTPAGADSSGRQEQRITHTFACWGYDLRIEAPTTYSVAERPTEADLAAWASQRGQ